MANARFVPGRRAAGYRAYFGAPPITGRSPCNIFKISRRPVGDCSGIGGSPIGHCRDTARKKSAISPSFFLKSTGDRWEIATGHRPGIAGALQPARLLKKNRWAMPKFQQGPRRLLIGRSPLSGWPVLRPCLAPPPPFPKEINSGSQSFGVGGARVSAEERVRPVAAVNQGQASALLLMQPENVSKGKFANTCINALNVKPPPTESLRAIKRKL